MLAKKANEKAERTRKVQERVPSEVQLQNLQAQEKKAVEKLERIKTWPKEHQEIAIAKTEDTLSQIRERMANLAST